MRQYTQNPAIGELSLFLRQDAVFLEAPDGVLLRGGRGDFFLKGKAPYRWLVALAPALSAGRTQDELCEGLDAGRRAAVERIVGQLVEGGFVQRRRGEPDALVDPAAQQTYAEQIAFLAHHTETPLAAFRRIRSGRVLVVGEGESARAAVRMLLRNGVGRVALCGGPAPDAASPGPVPDGGRPGTDGRADDLGRDGLEEAGRFERLPAEDDVQVLAALARWRPDAVLAVPQGPSLRLLDALFHHAAQNSLLFLAGRQQGKELRLGPLLSGRNSPCWTCAQLQQAEYGPSEFAAALFGEKVSGRSRNREILHPAVAAAVGSELAAEMFKSLSGCMESELTGALVIRDVLSLESVREPLHAHPHCPDCPPPAAPDDHAQRLHALAAGEQDVEEGRLSEAPMTPLTGLLAAYDDADLSQHLVKTGSVRRNGPPGPAAFGHSHLSLERARADAVRRLAADAAARAGRPAFLPVLRATPRQVAADAGIAPAAAPLLSPSLRTAPDVGVTWVQALSLTRRAAVWIPAEAAFGDAQADVPGPTGHTAGSGFAETALSGILAALLRERLLDRLAGKAEAQTLVPTTEEAARAELSILPALERRSGELRLCELTSDGPARVAVVGTDGTQHPSVHVAGVGLNRTDALLAALLELAGVLQNPHPGPRLDGPRTFVCPDNWPALGPTGAVPTTGPADGPVPADLQANPRADLPDNPRADLTGVLEVLRSTGRDALFVSTTPPFTRRSAPLITGRVLLTR
ncbi:TOMM precursor leader peptide-binding protein [Streptomyces sp. CA-294286]|uniref:TOMM precursor leader peptide-binding protein n=1 Tax=Streptomyces sp. CA-294286 TaxID=3240070 RepID=UPI003D8F7134